MDQIKEENLGEINLNKYAVNSDDRTNWLDEFTSKKTTPIISTKGNNLNKNDNLNFKFDITESKNDKNLINDTIDNTIE